MQTIKIIKANNTIELKPNFSMYPTFQERLIKSNCFLDCLKIIVIQSNKPTGKKVIEIFENLSQNIIPSDIEKEIVYSFIKDEHVSTLIQKFLLKLSKQEYYIKGSYSDITKIIPFINFIEGILSINGYKKIERYIGEVADIVALIIGN